MSQPGLSLSLCPERGPIPWPGAAPSLRYSPPGGGGTGPGCSLHWFWFRSLTCSDMAAARIKKLPYEEQKTVAASISEVSNISVFS